MNYPTADDWHPFPTNLRLVKAKKSNKLDRRILRPPPLLEHKPLLPDKEFRYWLAENFAIGLQRLKSMRATFWNNQHPSISWCQLFSVPLKKSG